MWEEGGGDKGQVREKKKKTGTYIDEYGEPLP